MPFKESKDLTRKQLSKYVGIEKKRYYIHEDGTDRALEVLSEAEDSCFVRNKLDSALLTDWAQKLLVDRYNGWEYVVADYIFDTPEFIKILNARDLKNLLIDQGSAGYLNAWPDVESKLLEHDLINQFLSDVDESLDNESLKDLLKHLKYQESKEIIKEELKKRSENSFLDKVEALNATPYVSTFFQQVEKQHTIDETWREESSKPRSPR